MYHPESTNSPETPESLGQVSVFRSPHNRDVLLADIAMMDYRSQLIWCAIPESSTCYEAVMQDYHDGVLDTVNYSLYIEPSDNGGFGSVI